MIPQTKIIVTLGPASGSYKVLRKMILAGLDVVRINFSHGRLDEWIKVIGLVRKINKKYRRAIKFLGDLEGYRIRVGRLKNPIELKKRKIYYFTKEAVLGEGNLIPFDYRQDIKDIKKGQFIYIDDGNLCLVVEGYKGDFLKTRVVVPGILKERKGINFVSTELRFKGITPKDRRDIQFCIENNFDYIAQSFVREKDDILKIKELVPLGHKVRIVAKIENPQAIKNIDNILDVSDGLMVARGDLGVTCPIYEVAILQKEIIKKAKLKKRFAITATQMLESMTENIRPTRAEVSDVTNAIIDGTDFVMLSAETAIGRYPVEAVRMMNEIIKATEIYLKR
ncbi:MAG: pyruvate kinase [Candidatus Omnitrophica bacterium]|nr:pyruvate kinase [Candidatus Omnitrophota bacterium]